MKFIDIVQKHIGPPVNVTEIIKEIGISINMDADLDPEISGELERKADGRFVISANAADGDARKRFTVAHELGHYMLHAHLIGEGVDDSKAYRSDPAGNFHNQLIKRRHETEANRFAAQLLMPKKMVVRRATSGKSVQELAGHFEVSVAAMKIRLNTLGIAVSGDRIS